MAKAKAKKSPTVHRTMRVPRELAARMAKLAKRDRITFTEQVIPLLQATYGEAATVAREGAA